MVPTSASNEDALADPRPPPPQGRKQVKSSRLGNFEYAIKQHAMYCYPQGTPRGQHLPSAATQYCHQLQQASAPLGNCMLSAVRFHHSHPSNAKLLLLNCNTKLQMASAGNCPTWQLLAISRSNTKLLSQIADDGPTWPLLATACKQASYWIWNHNMGGRPRSTRI